MKQNRNEASHPEGRTPIRPELLAGKLAAVRNYECPELAAQMTATPRLVETLWFLQAMSLRPGGLLKFVEELLAEFPECLGTPTMLAAKSGNYRTSEKLAIFLELPERYRPCIKVERDSDNVRGEILGKLTAREVAQMDARDRRAVESAVNGMDAEFFRAICRRAALEKLPEHFTALCTEKNGGLGHVESQEDVDEDGREDTRDALRRCFGGLNGWELLAQKAGAAPLPIPAGSV